MLHTYKHTHRHTYIHTHTHTHTHTHKHTHTHTRTHTHTHTHTHAHAHTHTHTYNSVGTVWHLNRQWTVAVCDQCKLLVREPCCGLLSEQGWMSYCWRRSGLPGSGWVIRRSKMDGINSHREFGISSTVSRPSVRWVRELVEWCCRCTQQSNSSMTGSSARVCKCQNSG